MRTPIFLGLILAFIAAAPVVAQPGECRIPGEKIHWLADFCMAALETDDEIPASACIEEELKKSFTDDCAAKLHYKSAMCDQAISRQQRKGGVSQCVRDAGFVGATVRNGGVGGR
jgi:hypothetical protein